MNWQTEYPDYPEEGGCNNIPGWVKGNPLNNKSYIEKVVAIVPEWREILFGADEALEALLPGYNIAQIKTKFSFVCFYIDYPEDTPTEVYKESRRIISEAETACKEVLDSVPPV